VAAEPRGRGQRGGPPESTGHALNRARAHARASLEEALAALEALLDAASLASAGEPASANALLAPVAQLLQDARARLDADDRGSTELLRSIAQAFDVEIARWEARAQDDPDARAVLRAFLGVRELLWEFGIRPGESAAEKEPPDTRKKSERRSGRKKVQRIRVQG